MGGEVEVMPLNGVCGGLRRGQLVNPKKTIHVVTRYKQDVILTKAGTTTAEYLQIWCSHDLRIMWLLS